MVPETPLPKLSDQATQAEIISKINDLIEIMFPESAAY